MPARRPEAHPTTNAKMPPTVEMRPGEEAAISSTVLDGGTYGTHGGLLGGVGAELENVVY